MCFRQAGINREILNKMWRNTYTNHRRELAWQRICLLFHCLLLLLLCEFSLFESRFLDTFGSVVVDWVIFSSLLGVLQFFPFFFFFLVFFLRGILSKLSSLGFLKIVFPYTSRAQVVRVLFRVVCSNGKSTMMLLDINSGRNVLQLFSIFRPDVMCVDF